MSCSCKGNDKSCKSTDPWQSSSVKTATIRQLTMGAGAAWNNLSGRKTSAHSLTPVDGFEKFVAVSVEPNCDIRHFWAWFDNDTYPVHLRIGQVIFRKFNQIRIELFTEAPRFDTIVAGLWQNASADVPIGMQRARIRLWRQEPNFCDYPYPMFRTFMQLKLNQTIAASSALAAATMAAFYVHGTESAKLFVTNENNAILEATAVNLQEARGVAGSDEEGNTPITNLRASATITLSATVPASADSGVFVYSLSGNLRSDVILLKNAAGVSTAGGTFVIAAGISVSYKDGM